MITVLLMIRGSRSVHVVVMTIIMATMIEGSESCDGDGVNNGIDDTEQWKR